MIDDYRTANSGAALFPRMRRHVQEVQFFWGRQGAVCALVHHQASYTVQVINEARCTNTRHSKVRHQENTEKKNSVEKPRIPLSKL
jgi:hypothetical protein